LQFETAAFGVQTASQLVPNEVGITWIEQRGFGTDRLVPSRDSGVCALLGHLGWTAEGGKFDLSCDETAKPMKRWDGAG